MCNHDLCDTLHHIGCPGGVGVVVYCTGEKPKILLCHESKKGEYNICSGKREPEDNQCFIMTTIRKLREKFKIYLDMDLFEHYFKEEDGNIRYTVHRKSPVFIGYFDSLDCDMINEFMADDLIDHLLPYTYKETNHAAWFGLDDPHKEKIAPFAEQIMKKLIKDNF